MLLSEHRERRCSWNSINTFYVLYEKKNDASEEICQVLGFKASEVKENSTHSCSRSGVNSKTRDEKVQSGYRKNM
jgi:hypothetical protein